MALLCIPSAGAAGILPAPASLQGCLHDSLRAKCSLGTASLRGTTRIPSVSHNGLPAPTPVKGDELPLTQGAQGPRGKPGAVQRWGPRLGPGPGEAAAPAPGTDPWGADLLGRPIPTSHACAGQQWGELAAFRGGNTREKTKCTGL